MAVMGMEINLARFPPGSQLGQFIQSAKSSILLGQSGSLGLSPQEGDSMKKILKSFLHGVACGLVAHFGAALAFVTIERIMYVLGHVAIVVVLQLAGGQLWA